MIVLEKSS